MLATYRTYQLPWEMAQEQDDRFAQIVKQCLIAVVVFGLLLPFMPVPEPDPAAVEEVPQRFAKLLLDKPKPPPPPEVKPQPKPQETVPKPQQVQQPKPEPIVQPQPQKAREKAAKAGLLPFAEQLADLRDSSTISNVMGDTSLNKAAGAAKRTERSVIASKAGKGSGGINTAAMSRNTGGGSLAGRDTTRVASPVAGIGGGGPKVAKGGSAPSRSREEIELVFEKNKGAIFALYNRALRKDPTLQGKLVLSLTIASNGTVTAVEVVSSELGDAGLERKLVQRVKLFRFQDKDVATVTTTKPIDFFPA
ncbi:MAG: TonB family protein [Gammaproteobacteria bacterium]|nr:TonB family protein [Gammaproteobacteria bacterium]NND55105.1 TonB family protein [Gammaproteobacteria bacterium]